MSIVRTRKKDCVVWQGGHACSPHSQAPCMCPACAYTPATLTGTLHGPVHVHTGRGPQRTCRGQAPGASEELCQVAMLPRWDFHFSTSLPFPRLSLPPLSLSLCLSISVSFPMSRSVSRSLSVSPSSWSLSTHAGHWGLGSSSPPHVLRGGCTLLSS